MSESNESSAPLLDPADARILGCLIEKQATTPETYPLTLNALVTACNQKTSREPVMKLEPGRVGQHLRELERKGLVRRVTGARADRWEHRAEKALDLTVPQRTLIGLLLLRGPQTTGELLTRSARMHDFDDTDDVRYQLERLIARDLVVLLPRRAGQREDRYMHLLCGAPEPGAAAPAEPEADRSGGDLEARIRDLEARIEALEARLDE